MHIKYNPNPNCSKVGDCTVRAISKALNMDWDKTYMDLCIEGLLLKDMPSANNVWGSYLKKNNFHRNIIPNDCPECYTVADFCNDNPVGVFILALNGHVVAVENGNYYDSWDSGDEIPIYYWEKN